MTDTVKILIADDHPLFRKGLRDVIALEKVFCISSESADGEAALTEMKERHPDVAILDVDMPKKSGLEVAKAARQLGLQTGIIILTMYKDEFFFNEAMDAGVLGYVVKESAVTDILDSIHAVAAGKYYISPGISGFLVNRSSKQASLRSTAPALESLTNAEKKVMALIAEGKTTAEIAELLFISLKTVENHRTHISQKLNLHGTHSLVKFAIANKSLL